MIYRKKIKKIHMFLKNFNFNYIIYSKLLVNSTESISHITVLLFPPFPPRHKSLTPERINFNHITINVLQTSS